MKTTICQHFLHFVIINTQCLVLLISIFTLSGCTSTKGIFGPTHLELAQNYFKERTYDSAIQECLLAINEDGQSIEYKVNALVLMGDVYAKNNMRNDALSSYNLATDLIKKQSTQDAFNFNKTNKWMKKRLLIKQKISKLPTDKSTFTDYRDGKAYKFVTIGTQIWMAENLKFAAPNSYCNQCDTYGLLYTYDEAKNSCPIGWHLPRNKEWNKLIDFLGGDSVAGGKLKETGTSHWKSPNTGATNESGFTALPGGIIVNNMTTPFGLIGNWWSYDVSNWYPEMAFGYIIINDQKKITYSPFDKSYLISVRCVKND